MQLQDETLNLTFAALSDPTRRAIMARLLEGEASVNELVEPFHLSQPTISKHIKVLERAGLVERRKDAQFHRCRINTTSLKQAAAWFQDYVTFWEGNLDRLGAYAKTLQTKEKPHASKPTRRR